MRRTAGPALLMVCILAAGPGWAAEAEKGCRDDQTVLDCAKDYLLVSDAAKAKAKGEMEAQKNQAASGGKEQAEEKVKKTPVTDQSPGAASTVRDFLPLFFTSLGLGTASSDDEALTLTFNPKWLRGVNAQGSLEARLYTPEPLEKLVMAAPESDREAVKGGIEDEIGDLDDVEVSATYTYRSENWGRDFEFHADRAKAFLADLVGSEETPAIQDLLDFLAELGVAQTFAEQFPEPVDPCNAQCEGVCAVVDERRAARGGDRREADGRAPGEATATESCQELCSRVCAARAGEAESPAPTNETKAAVAYTFEELRLRNEAAADLLEKKIVAAGEELTASRKRRVETLAESNYFRFGDLVNNQPQWTASLKVRDRDDLVGQKMVTFNFTFEGGTVNVNRFENWCEKKSTAVDAACLDDYWDAKGGNFDHLPRYKLAVDFQHLDDLSTTFTLPTADSMGDDAMTTAVAPVSVMLESSWKAVVTAAFGGFLTVDDKGNQLSRFDLEGKYEYVDDSDVRNERYVLTATYTQKLSDTASASIGMVYASDPEFRGAVDKEFSAHAGLRFKIDQKKDKKNGG